MLTNTCPSLVQSTNRLPTRPEGNCCVFESDNRACMKIMQVVYMEGKYMSGSAGNQCSLVLAALNSCQQ